MATWEKWALHILTAIVSVTGLVYLFMKYVMEPVDPFSVVNHPLQPLMLDLHILTAPMLVLIVGVVFRSHIARKLDNRGIPNRRSGMLALVTFPVMMLSGYLLQIVTQPQALRALVWLHVASGSLFFTGFLVHQVISFMLARASARGKGAAAGAFVA